MDFANTISEEQIALNRHLIHGSGVAVGDVNGDGWPDLYLARLEGPNALYLNQGAAGGGFRFDRAPEAGGAPLEGEFSTGAALEDLDGDGVGLLGHVDAVDAKVDEDAVWLARRVDGPRAEGREDRLPGEVGGEERAEPARVAPLVPHPPDAPPAEPTLSPLAERRQVWACVDERVTGVRPVVVRRGDEADDLELVAVCHQPAHRLRVVRVAADVERWPDILPHYRWVRFREKQGFGTGVVEMAAWRDFLGPLKYPTWWVSEMEIDEDVPVVRYRHIEGVTRKMDVAWQFFEARGGTLVRVIHDWPGGANWPLIGGIAARWVIGPHFVSFIAQRTLRGVCAEAERIAQQETRPHA